MSQNDFNEFKDLGRQIKDSVMSVVNMQESVSYTHLTLPTILLV